MSDSLFPGEAASAPAASPSPAPAYRVLARKYRPQRFEDLIGQEPMVRTLANSFAADRIHQAYILTGVRGVGKTTTARILARAFNYSLPGKIDAPSVDMPELGVHCQAIIEFAPCRRDRDGRRLAHRHRRRARDHRERPLPPGLGPHQGLHHRRSAHAVEARLQRSAEDAGRAARARQVPVRHDRDREGADHGALALHPLRPEADRGRPDDRAISPGSAPPRGSRSSRTRWR